MPELWIWRAPGLMVLRNEFSTEAPYSFFRYRRIVSSRGVLACAGSDAQRLRKDREPAYLGTRYTISERIQPPRRRSLTACRKHRGFRRGEQNGSSAQRYLRRFRRVLRSRAFACRKPPDGLSRTAGFAWNHRFFRTMVCKVWIS